MLNSCWCHRFHRAGKSRQVQQRSVKLRLKQVSGPSRAKIFEAVWRPRFSGEELGEEA